jgi:ribokinase
LDENNELVNLIRKPLSRNELELGADNEEVAMKILNFGSLNIDFVYQVDHMVRGGETISTRKMEKFCGGKGLNQSVALARAGAEVYHAGCIGKDGAELIKLMESSGVDCSFIHVMDEVSGHAIIQVDKEGENSILIYPGANGQITSEQIDSVLINLLDEIIRKASERGMKIALNPSPIADNITSLPLDKITYFLLNEIEGKELTDKEDPDDIIQVLRKRYPHSIVVLTLGSKGSIYDDGDILCTHSIYKVDAVDTTAAGDTFTGYFLNAITSGVGPIRSLQTASKASALAVSRMGAAPSIPTMQEVNEANLELKK